MAKKPCDSDFFRNAWRLLEDAQWGATPFEQAAFAVNGPDGRTEFVRWPASNSMFRAIFRGSVPPGTFAIVHTHPNSKPEPSGDDTTTSQRFGIPVYVVTRGRIVVAAGRKISMVTSGDWNPERCNRRKGAIGRRAEDAAQARPFYVPARTRGRLAAADGNSHAPMSTPRPDGRAKP
jgi:proteasome lid subunit RPN8/RPN11